MAQRANEVKLFGKWSYEGIAVNDISVQDFIAVTPKDQVYIPHTGARYQIRRFRKAQCPIVERLVNALMRKGRNSVDVTARDLAGNESVTRRVLVRREAPRR